MQRDVKHIITVVKYVLRTLPMMNVPVNDYSFLLGFLNKIVCGNSNIIEKRKPMGLILHATMMSGRPYQTNKIDWAMRKSILNSQDNCFNSFKGGIKCLLHVISIDVDKHFRLGNTLTPHSLHKVKISLAMNFYYLLNCDLV